MHAALSMQKGQTETARAAAVPMHAKAASKRRQIGLAEEKQQLEGALSHCLRLDNIFTLSARSTYTGGECSRTKSNKKVKAKVQ
eukprot:2149480-Pleurochrysis_carterae.AAC.3